LTLFLIVGLVLACFAGVLLVGAPYLPTLSPQVKAALTLADLKPGQTLLELGCGDGKVLLAAAKQGNKAIGYELNPIVAAIAWLRTRRYRQLVQVKCANFWNVDWPPADAIFVFLLPRFMQRLDVKVASYNTTKIKLVSFAFKIPGKKIDQEIDNVYLYKY
jgi:SAM-dependent methyltransferase